jgi:hypothetical protein
MKITIHPNKIATIGIDITNPAIPILVLLLFFNIVIYEKPNNNSNNSADTKPYSNPIIGYYGSVVS